MDETDEINMLDIQINMLKNCENIDIHYLSKIYTFCTITDMNEIYKHIKSKVFLLCVNHHKEYKEGCSLGFLSHCNNPNCEYKYTSKRKISLELLELAKYIKISELKTGYIPNITKMFSEYIGTEQHELYYLNIYNLFFNYPVLLILFKYKPNEIFNYHGFVFVYTCIHNYSISDEYSLEKFEDKIGKIKRFIKINGDIIFLDVYNPDFKGYSDKYLDDNDNSLITHIE